MIHSGSLASVNVALRLGRINFRPPGDQMINVNIEVARYRLLQSLA